MSDLVDQEIEKAKRRRARSQQDYERRLLDRRAIKTEAPRLWDRLVNSLSDAVNRFNDEFRDGDELPLEMLAGTTPTITIGTMGFPEVELKAELDLDSEVIRYSCKKTMNKGARTETAAGLFYFDVDDQGVVFLSRDDELIKIDVAALSLLKPLFSYARIDC